MQVFVMDLKLLKIMVIEMNLYYVYQYSSCEIIEYFFLLFLG